MSTFEKATLPAGPVVLQESSRNKTGEVDNNSRMQIERPSEFKICLTTDSP
jgi:hypothetical protein